MGHMADVISRCGGISRRHSDRMAAGIRPDQFARKPTWGIGGAEINTNHAAWCYGHLALYASRVVSLLGAPATGTETPGNWPEMFKDGTVCKDDPSGTIYPPMETIMSIYGRVYDAALAAIAKTSDADLAKPTPDPKTRERFPTVGDLVNFLVTSHIMMHLGQVSAWRRCMGLPAA